MFGQMIQLAETYAKSQGRTVVSQQDIALASERMAETSQRTLAGFFGGGAVDPRKLQEAWQFTQQQRTMQKEGITPGGVATQAMVQAGQTYGAGFGYDTNRVTIIGREGEPDALPLLPKSEVADRILDRIETLL